MNQPSPHPPDPQRGPAGRVSVAPDGSYVWDFPVSSGVHHPAPEVVLHGPHGTRFSVATAGPPGWSRHVGVPGDRSLADDLVSGRAQPTPGDEPTVQQALATTVADLVALDRSLIGGPPERSSGLVDTVLIYLARQARVGAVRGVEVTERLRRPEADGVGRYAGGPPAGLGAGRIVFGRGSAPATAATVFTEDTGVAGFPAVSGPGVTCLVPPEGVGPTVVEASALLADLAEPVARDLPAESPEELVFAVAATVDWTAVPGAHTLPVLILLHMVARSERLARDRGWDVDRVDDRLGLAGSVFDRLVRELPDARGGVHEG